MISQRGSGDVLLYLVFAAVMAVTTIGLGLGLAALFGEGYDFRTSESELLAYRVQECVQKSDMFAEGFILSACGLDANVLGTEHMIHLEREDGKVFDYGVTSYRESCFFKGAEGKFTYPQCTQFTFVTRDNKTVRGIVGSAQVARVVD